MDPLDPVRKLQARLQENTTHLGLRLVGFAVLPGTPDHVQAVFEISAEDVGKDDAKISEDQEALKFRAEIAAFERESQVDRSREALKKLMEKGGGFLD